MTESTESKEIHRYFKEIESKVGCAYEIASRARGKGFDPETKVDIPLAKNMAQRVEGLIGIVAPQIIGTGMTKQIHEYEKKYSLLDWRVGFKIAEDIAKQKFCTFKNKIEAMEVGIRVGFAYLTGGIVSAPLEGFVSLKTKRRRDGKEYLSMWYAGPVRGAGGTAAAVSVVLADYIRNVMDYSKYDPDEDEINRYITEVQEYHERVTNLQYLPSKEEIEFLARNLPVELNGDPTEQIEVYNYKDLPRVETNRIRGGVCLVMAEGLAQKATKVWKRLKEWGGDFNLDWNFLETFLDLQKRGGKSEDKGKKITPNYVYINDLVAGRPILAPPLMHGGFRLRYGRTRISGYSSCAIHPATMYILNKYIATGTQLRMERPGKATAITPCDTIEGPLIKLKDGSVVRINNDKELKNYRNEIEEILFLGDILISYGDFSENGHILVPPGYNEEWHVQELEKATVGFFGNLDLEKLSEIVSIPKEKLDLLIRNPTTKISARAAIKISKSLKIPLHPLYTYYWSTLSSGDIISLLQWLGKMRIETDGKQILKLILPVNEKGKHLLEVLGVEHSLVSKEFVVLDKNHSLTILSSLGVEKKDDMMDKIAFVERNKEKPALEIINAISKTTIKDKAGLFIGMRMGRPEKAKMRKLTGKPHTLFPVGEQGGRMRSFQAAMENSYVQGDFPLYKCNKCGGNTIYPLCEICNEKTESLFFCKECNAVKKEKCHTTEKFKNQRIDINHFFTAALNKLKMKTYPDLIKGVRGTSNKDHIPENICKGILRAKHNIFVNKDGTTRYDMTELPITHFKPTEIGTSIEKLRELGYEKDINNKPLTDKNQILELMPQDIILPMCQGALDEASGDVLLRVANFVDDLLKGFYGGKPFYRFKSKEDLVGELIIGLAPHISVGMVGRIIGFSQTQACFAHPLWHAALRRDCDGDECCVLLLMDALLNFSRQFLPDKRGTRTMDSPLVLTSKLIPAEVDDMVHGLDIVSRYPLEFYNGCLEFKYPWELEIKQIRNNLNTEKQYEGMRFTHNVSNINIGVNCSAYKLIPTMEDKLKGQMEIARKIRVVDESDVARLVIEKHFLKDIKGNLRKFSQQQFRCVKCNEKFRRPPLAGDCTNCGGNIIFTVSEGSIVKYLKPSLELAEKYNVPTYLKQTLELTKRRIESVFGKEKEEQKTLVSGFT